MQNKNSVPELVFSKTTILDKESSDFNKLIDLYRKHNEDEVQDIELDIINLKNQFVSGIKHTFKFDNGVYKETISLNFLSDTYAIGSKTERTPHYELFVLTGTCEDGIYMLQSQFSTCVICLCEHDHDFDYTQN